MVPFHSYYYTYWLDKSFNFSMLCRILLFFTSTLAYFGSSCPDTGNGLGLVLFDSACICISGLVVGELRTNEGSDGGGGRKL